MKLCLKCFSIWSDAQFCGRCRRALGRRCPKGHAQPFFSPATTCLTCNEGPVDGVPYLSLAWLPPALAVLLLVAAWRWAWDHPYRAGRMLWQSGVWGLGILFDTPPNRVSGTLREMAVLYVLLWLLSYLLPQALGRQARQFLKALPRQAWRGLVAIGRFLLRLILRPVGNARAKAAARHKDGGQGPE